MSQSHLARRLAAGLIALAFAATGAAARDYGAGPLRIGHPWSRPTPPGAPTAAGYLSIANAGPAPDRLLGASSPAADQVQLHQDSMTGGVMRMRPVAGGLVVQPHGSVTLAPGGYHLMFIGLKHPFVTGEHIPVTLTFQRAGAVRIALTVEATGGAAPDMSMPGMTMPGMR